VLLLGLVGFSSLVGEGSAADWSAVYLHDSLLTTPSFAASGFAAFSFAMAVCRFAGDRLVSRFGPVAVVRWGGFVAACGLGLALAVHKPEAAVAGFALLAPVIPLTISAAGNTGLGSTGAVLGRVVTISYLGFIVGPIVIGWTAEHVGLRSALGLPAALALVVALFAGHFASAAAGNRAVPDGDS
jgi:MFS family permease